MNNARLPSVHYTLQGYYYPAGSSDRINAELIVNTAEGSFEINANSRANTRTAVSEGEGKTETVSASDTHAIARGLFADLSISSRIGNVDRKIYLQDKALFETADNFAVDSILTELPHTDGDSGRISLLERSWTAVIVGCLITAVFVALFFTQGLPLGAGIVAKRLPVSVHETVSDGVLKSLDETLFSATKLTKAEQDEQNESFARLLQGIDAEGFDFNLHFRRMGSLPNAFALPSGDVVVTDGLVELADTQEEIESVMLHEIGHVLERHGMQHALEGSTITLLVTLALGDVSGIAQLAVALPAFLLTSSYSRKTETEADEFAFEKMQELGIDTIHFANIMSQMGRISLEDIIDAEDEPDEGQQEGQDEEQSSPGKSANPRGIPEYLSSHPGTESRIKRALELSTSRSKATSE